MRRRRQRQDGFTLLEVMIAIAIMTVAFAAILTSQSSSIAIATRAKDLNLAGWLAHNIMVESEHLLEGKAFTELKEVETKRFDAPFERFKWKREIKEFKFPELTPPQKAGEGVVEPVRLLTKTFTKFLNNAVRQMIITVSWPKGTSEQSLTITTYLVDLNAEFTPQL